MQAPLRYGVTEKTVQPWIDQHECVQKYLQRLNSKKERTAVYLYSYCNWAGKTPEELLALKTSFDNSGAELLLDKFVLSNEFPESAVFNIAKSVRAFYRNNYRQLQSAAGKVEYVPKKTRCAASKATCLKLYKACYTPRDQALVMLSTCTAIARETLSFLKWHYFEEDWMRQNIPYVMLPSQIIKGHGRGKYRGVQQVTFLTPETKKVLKDYRDWYAKTFNHVWREDDNVLLSVRDNIGEPLSFNQVGNIMRRLTKRAGINYSIHDGRIRVQTALENVGVVTNWVRKVKGRKVKGEESPYSKPAISQLREKFRLALDELQFLDSDVSEHGKGLSDEDLTMVKTLLEAAKAGKLKFTP